MSFYADSSFLVATVTQQGNATTRALATMAREREEIFFTPLNRHEIHCALRALELRGEIDHKALRLALEEIEADLREKFLVHAALDFTDIFRVAGELADQMKSPAHVRALDLMHIASARLLSARKFLSFDDDQRAAARSIGLEVGP